ncbi:MAG: peptidylprolyl isomerase [Cyanobacteria bacterium P01_A01_bin.17]
MKAVLQVGDQSFSATEVVQHLVAYQMLPQLSQEMIIDQAIAEVKCTPEEEEQARQQFFAQNKLTSDADLQAWMQHNGVTPAQLKHLILRPTKLEAFKRNTWGAQLGNHFLKQKQHLDRVIYSLIRTKDVAIAQELYFRIQEGEATFAELAKEYSQGPEAQTGGLIGPMELSQAHPKLAQLLRTSQPGQIFPPVRLDEWFLIVQLEKLLPAQLDDPTEKRLLNDLFQRWLKQQQQTVSLHFPEENPLEERTAPQAVLQEPETAEP